MTHKKKMNFMTFNVGSTLEETMPFTHEEMGAYMFMRVRYWSSGGSLPNDTEQLLMICRMRPGKKSNKVLSRVLTLFRVEGDTLINDTWDAEIEEAIENRDKRAKQTEAARARRWGKTEATTENDTDSVQKDTDAVTENVTENVTESPSPSPINSDTSYPHKKTSKKKSEPKPKQPDATEAEFLIFWERYPVKKARPQALKAFRTARKKAEMSEITGGLEEYIRCKPPNINFAYPASWLNAERWADTHETPMQPSFYPKNAIPRMSKVDEINAAIQRIESRPE